MVRVLKPQAEAAGWVEGYAREVRLLSLLERRGLPVPPGARAIQSTDGRLLATAAGFIEGTPLWERHLRRRARVRAARELAAFLTALHTIPPDETRELGLPDLDLGTELYAPLIEEALSLIGPQSAGWLSGRFEAFLAAGGSAAAPRVPLHGDAHPAHIFVDDDGAITGVIDFGDALIGDPAFDFAGTLNRVSLPFFKLVAGHYRGPAAGDEDLERRARFYIDVVPIYEVVFGERLGDAKLARRGRLRLAARAAAATRAAR